MQVFPRTIGQRKNEMSGQRLNCCYYQRNTTREEGSKDRLFSTQTLSPFKKTNTKFLPFSKDIELSHTTHLDLKLILIQSKVKAAHMYKQGVLPGKTLKSSGMFIFLAHRLTMHLTTLPLRHLES